MVLAASWTTDLELAPAIAGKARKLFIGGDWIDAQSDETISVVDPSTGGEVAKISRGTPQDVDRAVAAARKAFERGAWPQLTGNQRAKLLWKLADLIEANKDEFALLEAIDGGKPLAMARAVDVMGSAEKLRYVSGWASKIFGETLPLGLAGEFHTYTLREPIGVAALIVAWNFPLGMAVAKMSEALAAGCTVIIKPAELTSLATLRLGELIQEAGIPEGVVNIVTGYGPEVGQALADHPDVDKISFTGSTAVGKQLVASAAGNLKRLTLELGGKSPAVVFADADFDLSVQGVARNIFYNSGQICAAGSRSFVHKSIYDRFVAGLIERANAMQVGPATATGTEMGPLISERQLQRVTDYIDSGSADGATIVTGGNRREGPGFFIDPTIIADTNADMKIVREEIFGPVLCISPFGDDDDLNSLAAQANDTPYGLNAYVYTRDLSTAHRMARRMKAGVVRVNGAGFDMNVPFGGYKQSGWGREQGREGVLSYTEQKSVVVPLA